jgi:acetylornithine deacetylase
MPNVDSIAPTGPISRRTFCTLAAAAAGAAATARAAGFADDPLLASMDNAADLELIRKMVQIRSYSREEAPLAKFLVGYMKDMGLDASLMEVQPGRYNAIGILKGSGGGKSLIYNGHIDTNPITEGWTVDPIGGVVKDGCIWGIGVSNMKASVAAFIGATRGLMRSGTKLRGDVIVEAVVGELTGGDGTRMTVEKGLHAEYFINGEPTDLALMTVHATGLSVTINTIGVTRHMSKQEESVSAIDTMYKVIERLNHFKYPDSPKSNPEYASIRRLNVGTMKAGLGRDMAMWRGGAQVPDFAQIQVSVRYGPDLTPELVLDALKKDLAQLHAEDPKVVTEIETKPFTGRRFTYETAKDAPIVKAVAAAYEEVVGKAPVIGAPAPYRYYGTDAPILQHAGMSGIVCGVGGKYNTMPDERVELKDYYAATRIYGLTAKMLCS